MGENKDRCTMLRMTSAEAVGRIERYTSPIGNNGTRDLVFIDALHDYESVKEDIGLWWPQVRTGGILALHDFNHQWPGVERAVAESFNLMHIGVASDSVAFILKQSEDQYRGNAHAAQAA